MIGALTKQLIRRTRKIPSSVLELFRQRTQAQRSMDAEDAKIIFNNTLGLGQFETVYICIDALDECEIGSRTQLLQFLKAIDSPSIRLFLTGRYNVEAELTSVLSDFSSKTMSIIAAEEDIRTYLSQKLEEDRYPKAMNEAFKHQIMEKLVEISQGL